MIRMLLSLVLASGIGVGMAYAQEKAPPTKKSRPTAEERFKALNKAGDGKLTLAEFLVHKRNKEKAEAAFKAADKGNKGYLTLDEFKTIYPPRYVSRKKPADKTPEKTPEKTPDQTPEKAPEGK